MGFDDTNDGTAVSEAEVALGMPLPLESKLLSQELQKPVETESNSKQKVVILGSGWGGFNFGNQISKE